MSVTMSIGPSGEPPSTSFVYDGNFVTLNPRPAVERTAQQMISGLLRIASFMRAVRDESPEAASSKYPYLSQIEGVEGEENLIHCRFKCFEKFEQTATIDLNQHIVFVDERAEEKTINWTDFESYVRFLREILAILQRP